MKLLRIFANIIWSIGGSFSVFFLLFVSVFGVSAWLKQFPFQYSTMTFMTMSLLAVVFLAWFMHRIGQYVDTRA